MLCVLFLLVGVVLSAWAQDEAPPAAPPSAPAPASDQAAADHLTGFMATQGTSLTLVFTCPSTSPFPATYSATSTTVTLYYSSTGVVYTLH